MQKVGRNFILLVGLFPILSSGCGSDEGAQPVDESTQGSQIPSAGAGGTPTIVGTGGTTTVKATGGSVHASGGKKAGVGGQTAAAGKSSGAGGAQGGAGGTAGAGKTGKGTCCPDGNCLCHGPDPTELTSEPGPYATETYTVAAGCVYYPTDTEGLLAAVSISDGFMGAGGCMMAQTGGWGPFLASWGIVTMIVNTTGADMPQVRGRKLLGGIEAFKEENEVSGSPLFHKLSGRYGTSGFSMGGGGTTMAAAEDPSLLSSVGIMAWTPVGQGVTVPTLFICGTADTLAFCSGHGGPAYNAMPEGTPRMMITVNSAHIGQPSTGGGMSGAWGLAWHKVFLEGDERWRPILAAGDYTEAADIE